MCWIIRVCWVGCVYRVRSTNIGLRLQQPYPSKKHLFNLFNPISQVLKDAYEAVNTAQADLGKAERQMKLMKSKIAAAKTAKEREEVEKKYGSLAAAAEGEVANAEAGLESALEVVKDASARLKRAQRVREREMRFLPLFHSLAEQKDYTCVP